ncbi:MAG: hypothetical protein PHX07_05215 [Candidatus Marinimicrobia bacterium]|jgi:hypothetical protein|nr:hypothetical protein [Candidatus Neomarinimicrobiota bacterium]MDD4961616.1 hypothetical protein [Candidatus Neomarinimicrobiota bacterium]MDD5710035.1 hypothetical protein [Candidatus Neomarinimicrobiota bacterium]MDX9777583.1 hypothetical protein [bacterium]
MKCIQHVKASDILPDDGRFQFRKDAALRNLAGAFLPLLWKRSKGLLPVLIPGKLPPKNVMLDALIFSEDTAYEDILAECLKLAQISGAPSYFDIANLLVLLDRHSPGYDRQIWAKRLGMGKEQLRDCRILSSYNAAWSDYFIQKKAPLKRILNFSLADLRETLEFLLPLNPGINVLENIATLLQEIARREGRDLHSCLQDCRKKEPEANPEQEIDILRNCLYRRRYPGISAFEEDMKEMLAALKLPAGITVEMDLSAETPGITLKLKARDPETLQDAVHWLSENKEHLEEILHKRERYLQDRDAKD